MRRKADVVLALDADDVRGCDAVSNEKSLVTGEFEMARPGPEPGMCCLGTCLTLESQDVLDATGRDRLSSYLGRRREAGIGVGGVVGHRAAVSSGDRVLDGAMVTWVTADAGVSRQSVHAGWLA
jgi:hypothetical protein